MREFRSPNPLVDCRRPRQGAAADLNPPGFVWRPISGAASYELRIDRMLLNSKDRPKIDGLPVPAEQTSTGICRQTGNFAAKQVSDACRKLLAKGDVHRSDDGKYDLSEAVIPAE